MNAPALSAIMAATLAITAFPAFAATQTFEHDAFTKARFETSVDANIVVGPAQSITVEARDPATLDDLRIEVVNGELHAWMERDLWDFLAFRNDDVKLTITVPALSGVEASSSADVVVTGIAASAFDVAASSSASVTLTGIKVDQGRFEASSSASINVDGSCTVATIEISSSATFAGETFKCVDLNLQASSSADARLFGTGSVDADVSSSASVILAGNPARIDQHISSSGSLDIL